MTRQRMMTSKQTGTKQRKILVVDDEPGFTRLLKLNLEETGRYVVRVENDPREAIGAALDFQPDLMLIDVMMPGLDGGDVANLFTAHPDLRHIPMLFLTATVRHREVEMNHGNFGGLQFLAKPLNINELLACLDERFTI